MHADVHTWHETDQRYTAKKSILARTVNLAARCCPMFRVPETDSAFFVISGRAKIDSVARASTKGEVMEEKHMRIVHHELLEASACYCGGGAFGLLLLWSSGIGAVFACIMSLLPSRPKSLSAVLKVA